MLRSSTVLEFIFNPKIYEDTCVRVDALNRVIYQCLLVLVHSCLHTKCSLFNFYF